jgi:7-cyano-7-deazaguanine reductase
MEIPLGRHVSWPTEYAPELLFRIERTLRGNWEGYDRWTCYEVSWLDPHGCPRVATATVRIPATSRYLVESKSLKLYLGSISETMFTSKTEVAAGVKRDLEELLDTEVGVVLYEPSEWAEALRPQKIEGVSLDRESVQCSREAGIQGEALGRGTTVVEETLYTDSFRSLCPVTGQPDYASVIVTYRGAAIERGGLLRYLVSYRWHQGFHEQCCETIYSDLMERCAPERLRVECLFTRRGGIEINPVRSSPGWGEDRTYGRSWRQ